MKALSSTSSKFTRDIITLVFGTAFSQLLPIAISPILTRLYTPDDFGTFGLLAGFTLLLTILATCRFEQILFVSKGKRKKELAVKFILLNIFIVSVLTFIIIFLTESDVINYFVSFNRFHLYLVPIGVSITSSYIVLRAWLNRNGEYKVIRSNLIMQSVALSSLQVVFGLLKQTQSFGLLLGDFLGKLLTTLLIFVKFGKKKTTITFKKYFYFWSKFKNIPKIQMPAALIGTFSLYAPMLLLPFFFGMQNSGIYFLVFKVVMLPISLIGNAITDVFKVDAANSLEKRGEYQEDFLRVFKVLAPLSCLIFFMLLTLGPILFPFIFGEKWEGAGELAQILAILAAIRFLASPLSYSFILRERFYYNLIFQTALLTAVLVSIFIGHHFNIFYAFAYSYAILATLVYAASVVVSYRLSKRNG